MATKVMMEALSPTMEEGRVVEWLKNEGDEVSEGETLAEVETDKAVMELVARGSGVLRKIVVSEGKTADVGTLVAVIGDAEEDISDLVGEGDDGGGEEGKEADRERGAEAKGEQATRGERETSGEEDREGEEEGEEEERQEPSPDGKKPTPQASSSSGRIKASPLARRLAAERDLDLNSIKGSGPGGRIIKRDLEGAKPREALAAQAPGESYRDVELTQIRKTIARRLAQSLGPVPHFFLTVDVDMERVTEARADLNDRDPEQKISFNDIILKVVAMALNRHPECNAWWQDDHIRYFNEVHLAMAVAVEQGLITPVIRNAHLKSLREISTESRELVSKAQDRKLTPEEYTGSTFSVSNLGMFGIEEFTAVINPPEAGIIAVGGIREVPVVVDGELEIRKRMKLTMSCDHRVIDGATGAKFLATVQGMLENPLALIW